MSFIKYLIYTGNIFLVLNTVLYIKALHKNKAFIVFTIFLITISIIQTATTLLSSVFHQNNLYLSTIFFISQFLLLSTFYNFLLKKRIILYTSLVTSIFLTYQYVNDWNLFYIYNSIGISLTNSILIVYSLVYLYNSINKRKPQFLITNIGIFLYLICSTLIFASGNLVFNINVSFEMYDLLFKLNAFLYIIFQILIFIEWRKNYYQKTLRS